MINVTIPIKILHFCVIVTDKETNYNFSQSYLNTILSYYITKVFGLDLFLILRVGMFFVVKLYSANLDDE